MLKITPYLHLKFFYKGFKEAFNWPHVAHLVTTSKTIQKTLLKSFALNGVAYLGMLILLETFYNTPDHHLFGYSYTDLTGYPLYLICLLLNSKIYSRIAQENIQYQRSSDDDYANFDIAAAIHRTILYGNFAAFLAILRQIPFVGRCISFFIHCILMSYYCFEYKWVNQEWSIEQSMNYVEQHWAYCIGFGLPATTLTFFLSTLRAGGVFALLYPTFIMMATAATPEPTFPPSEIPPATSSLDFSLPYRVPIFFGVRLTNQYITNAIRAIGGTRGETLFTEKKKGDLGKLV